jgi:hypothetical protein
MSMLDNLRYDNEALRSALEEVLEDVLYGLREPRYTQVVLGRIQSTAEHALEQAHQVEIEK